MSRSTRRRTSPDGSAPPAWSSAPAIATACTLTRRAVNSWTAIRPTPTRRVAGERSPTARSRAAPRASPPLPCRTRSRCPPGARSRRLPKPAAAGVIASDDGSMFTVDQSRDLDRVRTQLVDSVLEGCRPGAVERISRSQTPIKLVEDRGHGACCQTPLPPHAVSNSVDRRARPTAKKLACTASASGNSRSPTSSGRAMLATGGR